MRRGILAALAFAAVLLAVQQARAANSWGLPEEQIVRFQAQVVDLLCELTGDCPQNCGEGRRQLALKTDEGRLVLPAKNGVPFAGTAAELIDFCGKRVEADGLYTTAHNRTIFALQFVREAPEGKWRRANRFTGKWAAEVGVAPDSDEAKQWFRNDPRVKALIEKDGKLGLGLEADKKFLAE